MRIIIVGPGRAGMSLAAAAQSAGHEIAGIVGKERAQAITAAEPLGAASFTTADELPPAELLIIATRDAAIAPVAGELAPSAGAVEAAVHVSGLTPVSALARLEQVGLDVGSFHPLQTLPTPEAGASRLGGAWVAVTADEPLRSRLHELAMSMGSRPFDLSESAKATYHAAAAAAANFPLVALIMASDLFAAAGVPFAAARPLVEAVVANAFDLGPRPALTGPVARGDVATVRGQLDAVARTAPEWVGTFSSFVLDVARLAGRGTDFEKLLADWEAPRGSAP